MAVAVKNMPESQTRTALGSLVFASIAGAVYILACVAIVFWGVPRVWDLGIAPFLANLTFVSYAGLIIVEAVTIGILAFVGSALVGPAPPRGLRAGVFLVLAWLFGAGFVTVLAGRVFENFLGGMP